MSNYRNQINLFTNNNVFLHVRFLDLGVIYPNSTRQNKYKNYK